MAERGEGITRHRVFSHSSSAIMLKYVGITAAVLSYFTGSSDKDSVVLTLQENQVKRRKFLLVLVATSLSVCYDNPNTTGKTSNVMSSRLCNALISTQMLIYDFFFLQMTNMNRPSLSQLVPYHQVSTCMHPVIVNICISI